MDKVLEFIGLVCVLTVIKVIGWGLVICVWIVVYKIGSGELRDCVERLCKGGKRE